MKTKKQLLKQIKKDTAKLDAQAFEIYCTRELSSQMGHLESYKEAYNNSKERMKSLTIKKLKKDFNTYSSTYMKTPKEVIIQEILTSK